jgi:hypothetical protein
MSELTLKQEKFVHNYIKNDGNATQAVLEAGYSKNYNTARMIGSENLTKPSIKQAIDEKKLEILNPEQIKRKITEKTNSTNEAIQLKACELLGRTYAMFIDRNINENHNIDESELDKIRDKALMEAEQVIADAKTLTEGETKPEIERKE